MNSNEALAEVYRGAKMGVQTINNLLMKVTDNSIYNELKYQLRSYEEIASEAYEEIINRSNKPRDISLLNKTMAKMSIGINTFINNNPSHIADMMIKGSTMGITNTTKALNNYNNENSDISNLIERFVKLEQSNIDRLKRFL